MVYVIYIVKVHPEVVLPVEEIMVTILDSKHFPFVIRHSHVPSIKLNICVPRLFSSSSVTKGFPCSNGVRTGATGISSSSCPVACSSINLVLWDPPRVGLATLASGGARVLFVVSQAEEWSCHISSDFSPCGPLSESDHSPRVSFSVLVGCLGLREAFFLILEVPFPSAGGFRLQLFFYISSSLLF